MLILARRPGQKILFPGLGITVEVLRTNGSITRLGIEAPQEVAVLRDEVHASFEATDAPAADPALGQIQQDLDARRRRHALRNQLNRLMLKLQLLQARLEQGSVGDSDATLDSLFGELASLETSTRDDSVGQDAPRVLVVEDQDNERELLAECLRLAGVQVITAGNGRDALERLRTTRPPDLVLLDMRMPELDGPAFLSTLREDQQLQSLKVFAVTGSSRSEFPPSLPVDGWFVKPLRVDSLLTAVKSTAGRRQVDGHSVVGALA